MPATKDTSIRVKETTRYRLDTLKGNKTYDSFLCDVLTYFETTGIMPQSLMISPVMAVKEQASRVIEVVRGIEKTQKVTLKAILDSIHALSGQQIPASSAPVNSDEYMHINQVQDLLNEAEQLRKENDRKAEELNRLRTQVEMAGKQMPADGSPSNAAGIKKILLETVTIFDERKKTATFNDDIYEFDRNTFDKWIDRLRNDINKL